MSKTYGKKVYDALKENKLKSISILLEETQDEENTEDKADSVFAALDDESSDVKKDDKPKEQEAGEN